jgi:hypothetical protein
MKITSISPSTVTAGGAGFTLTVSGTGFTSTSEVYWDDEERDTTFVSSTTLTAAIPASDIVEEGSVSIKVVDSAPGGETSNEVTLSIVSSGLFFPQIVVGGGYSTVFTLFNTSDQDVVCNLVLTDEEGNPFTANLTSVTAGAYSPGGDDRIETINPFLAFNLRWGGTKIITMNPVNSGDPAKVGWATVSVNGAKVYGVATYKQTISGILTTSIGVLSTPPVNYATIPVDNDSSQGRYTGFAIANPGSTNIYIKVVAVDQNGLPDSGVQPAKLNPIGPNEQVAIFLHELIPSRANFKGTVILRVLNNKQAVITALVQDHGIFSAIPVVADKISSVP